MVVGKVNSYISYNIEDIGEGDDYTVSEITIGSGECSFPKPLEDAIFDGVEEIQEVLDNALFGIWSNVRTSDDEEVGIIHRPVGYGAIIVVPEHEYDYVMEAIKINLKNIVEKVESNFVDQKTNSFHNLGVVNSFSL